MKPILMAFLLGVFSLQLQAQVFFTLASSPGVGHVPDWVAAADVNGDGRVDLISANTTDNTLSVLTNNGSGGFVLASSPGVGSNPNGVTAADVNGDGWADLISANYYGNSLSVLINNGSGAFLASGTYSVGQYPRSVVAADVNGDGKLDLICTGEGADTLTVLTNNGSGGFALASTISVAGSPVSVVAADVNGDGKLDLTCANFWGSTLFVLTNAGTGTFVIASTNAVGTNPRQVVAADVNGDGKVDLISVNSGDDTLSVLTNNGSGGFVLSFTPGVGAGPFGLVSADVNGDGRADLISANYSANALTVLTNNGSGGFVPATAPGVGSAPYGIAATDVNGDGRVDLITANTGDNTLSVLVNGTPFPPASPPIITAQPIGQTNAAGTTAIFDVEVMAVTGPQLFSYQWRLAGTNLPSATNNPLVLPNLMLGQAGNYAVVITNSAGSVTSSPAILNVIPAQARVSFTLSSSPSVGSLPQSVVAADVNGDGNVDLISANSTSQTLSVLTNNGSGGFVLASSPGVGNTPVVLAAADVNGDGKLDLITPNYYGGNLSVLTNKGGGGFVLAATPGVGTYPYMVVATDVNGDGRLDLVCANQGSSSLSVLTNNGSGGFVLASSPGVGTGPSPVVAADINGDGKVDLICGNYTDSTLSVLTNNGHGGFVLASTPPVGTNPNGLVAADVNGDGKVDLISANTGNNTLSVLTNNGGGSFVLSSTLNVGSTLRGVTAADVNGDGKVDLISANTGNNTLSVLTNTGSGGFLLATTLSVGGGPFGVAAADVNGDGKVDLISANSSGNTLSVLTNGTPFPPASPPIITTQPTGQTNMAGATAVFNVGVMAVTGPQLFSYQWRLAGTNLPAGTNNSLVLSNLALGQAGNYDVVITNSAGSVTSSPAILSVQFVSITVNGQPAIGTITAIASATVSFSGGYTNGFMFYTLDGSTPTTSSTLYSGPFTVTNSVGLRVMNLSVDFSQTYQAPLVTIQIIPVYNLQTSVIGGGTISTNPASASYVSNSVVALTATPNANWVFDHWAGDAAGSQNPLSVTMNGPRNVQAVFTPTACPLTLSTPGGGSVTANGQVISPATYYPTGSVVTLAVTTSNGWSFLGWQGSASGTNNPLSVTMNQTNNIQAIFGTIVGTNAVGGGSIVLSQPNPIPFGTRLTVSAVPYSGEFFVLWGGAVTGTNAPTTIVVTNATPVINALFATLPAGKYSLGVVVIGNGSVVISPRQNYYNPGDPVTLSASTTNFYGWTGDVSGTNNPLMVVMSTNKVVQANFVASPAVTVSPLNLIVPEGSNVIFSASATGLPPLTYQWNFNGTNINGATNTLLTLTNVQLSQAGNYAVLVTNSYGSVLSSNAVLVVNPSYHFVWSQIPSPRFANTPFTVVIQAQNLTNGIATNFTGPVVLLSTNGIPIAPAVSGGFIQGVWTGAVTIAQPATNLVLQANGSFGSSGLANPINIVSLPVLITAPAGGFMMVSWPISPSGFGLETTAGLSPANWIPVTTSPILIGDQYLLPVPMLGTNAFFRLRFSGP